MKFLVVDDAVAVQIDSWRDKTQAEQDLVLEDLDETALSAGDEFDVARLVLKGIATPLEWPDVWAERFDFEDYGRQRCSLQRSSLATEDAIWLGAEREQPFEVGPPGRMLLTREMAAELIPRLIVFVREEREEEP